jgi:hypothetical protein
MTTNNTRFRQGSIPLKRLQSANCRLSATIHSWSNIRSRQPDVNVVMTVPSLTRIPLLVAVALMLH